VAKFGQNPGQDVSLTSLQDGFDQDRLRDQTATTVAPAVGKILGIILLRKQTLDEKCICTLMYMYIHIYIYLYLFIYVVYIYMSNRQLIED
jgi:hypothetical protein